VSPGARRVWRSTGRVLLLVFLFTVCMHSGALAMAFVGFYLYYLLGGRGTRHLVAHKSKTAKTSDVVSDK
jgi:hypothetical protein